MDQCDISTTKGAGTRIVLAKTMSRDSPVITPTKIGTFGKQLAALPDNVVLAEVQLQNRDLIDALEALQSRQVELLELTETLEKSSRDIAVLNAQLDEKALHLESADRHKDEFLAILGHELRGPLSAAGMAGSMLQMPSVPEARVRHLGEVITRQVGHMNRLVEDLLDVSRVSRGLLALDQACVDMTTVVLDAVEQIGPFIKTKAHELSIALPDEPCWVFGDRARLIQVVTNLLSNAVRYTPEGGRITLSLVTEQNSTSITVRDSGIGINAELLPYLFDLYVQAERSSDRKNGGLGLGLALVKSLVEAHGGTVTVKSDGKDLGSSFTVRLRRIITSASEATA
jgi:signal transduction histidine kinase